MMSPDDPEPNARGGPSNRHGKASLLRGFGWNTSAQVATAISSLVITPIVIHRLGLSAYGVFTLATLATLLLQQLDGGLLRTATRYFGVALGADETDLLSRQFMTMAVMTVVLACTLGAAVFAAASPLVGLFGLGSKLTPAAIYAARIVAISLPVGLFSGLLAAVLQANSQFGVTSAATVATRVAYLPAVVLFVHHGRGVQTIMLLGLLQLIVMTFVIAPPVARHLRLSELRLLPWREVRAMLSYASKIQAVTVASLVNVQADGLIIGALLPVRYVALYGIGANVASLILTVPLNALSPWLARLSQTFGRSGAEAAFHEYRRAQELWVLGSTGFCAIVVGAAVFQIEGWLGPRFVAAGLVCVILTAGNTANLWTGTLTVYLQVTGRPEIEARYGLLSMVINIVLTAATAWLGMYAIVAATSIGQIAASMLLLRLARARVSTEIPSFWLWKPVVPAFAAGVTSAVFGYVLERAIPFHGAATLVIVSLCVIPGALAFMATLVGPKALAKGLLNGWRDRSFRPLISAIPT